MPLENRISSNINLTLTNVKRYQRYAKVVHGSVKAKQYITSERIALIVRSCDVHATISDVIVFVSAICNSANSL